jgi:hypothetical protein
VIITFRLDFQNAVTPNSQIRLTAPSVGAAGRPWPSDADQILFLPRALTGVVYV